MKIKLRLSNDSYYDRYCASNIPTVTINTESKICGRKLSDGELIWVSGKQKYETFRRRLDVNF